MWEEFLDKVDKILFNMGLNGTDIPFFRGHSNCEWSLLPSLYRLDYNEKKRRKLEKILYYDFLAYSGAILAKDLSSWEVLFEMRHAGIPTRLLDWTENFGVALYFALKDNSKNPCIWILDPFKLNKKAINGEVIQDPKSDFKYNYYQMYMLDREKVSEMPVAIYPAKQCARIFAQKGVFTLQGSVGEPLENIYPDCVTRVDLPSGALSEAKRFLNLAGINEYTVFPDTDGLARYLIERHCM